MPELSKDVLRTQVKERRLEPVYVLHGSETYLRDIAAKTISDHAFAEGELRDFNEDEFSLANPDSIKVALAAAEQLPMMAARRVIRVTDVCVAATSNRDTLKEEYLDAVAAYLQDPARHTVLIFVADELNGNRKFSTLLKASAAVVDFTALSDAELATWAGRRFADLGSVIDAATLRYLITVVGNDLHRLSNEIGKLSAAAMPENRITSELIDTLVPRTRALINFQLTDDLFAGRKTQAIASLQKLLDDGAEPLALLGLVASNLRRLVIAKEMIDAGADRAAIAGQMRMPYGSLNAFLATARRADKAELLKNMKRVAETDLAIKTSVGGGGPTGSRLQLEMLVCEMAMSG